MAWSNETYLVGERIRVEGERDLGIVTRLDLERGLIYVMFKRLREEVYSYPESIANQTLTPLVNKRDS
ncbi:Uncharacterised protein [Acholeplasma oculi]|uniref:Uncharacterized protein n=1 Tax=Acholeplasma oculi TaxID=35623 RepID=A0A061AB28_9MOLU|nr:hypothetical protein [Acholeplasma oculi]CDR31058.1 hypothetical protein Aocu_09850 [Acholeplasma oculi]SKC36694.1 hypothetical protein SAMN02745122_0416 [Acholeplasma oculi]SUT90647.1 Uncharacterised protein [Acholeplasma oculi]